MRSTSPRGSQGLRRLAVGLLLTVLAPALAPAAGTAVEWHLSAPRVVSPGTEVSVREGKTRTGLKIEADARTETEGALFPEGTFTITLTVFKPSKDGAGKKGGEWQLRGEWTITAANADPAAARSRYSLDTLSGGLNAVLPYDPAAQNGSLEANVRLQRGGGRPWAGLRAQGKYTGTSNFEGKLTTPFVQ